MNTLIRYECQECFRLHATEEAAFQCHAPKKVFLCGACETEYSEQSLAQYCCIEGAGPKHPDINAIKKVRLDGD